MGERGQATAEWVALLLGLALAFGGALTAARGADFGGSAHGLGVALSERMTCAVHDGCSTGARPRTAPLPARRPAHHVPALRLAPRFLGRGVPPAAAPSAGRRLIRSLARAGQHAWVVCFGVRRLRQELDHAQSPREVLSPHDALDVLNECLNPLEFLLP
jgi:hypothetical protein